MPHSVDEAMQRAEQLERNAHDAIPKFRLEGAPLLFLVAAAGLEPALRFPRSRF